MKTCRILPLNWFQCIGGNGKVPPWSSITDMHLLIETAKEETKSVVDEITSLIMETSRIQSCFWAFTETSVFNPKETRNNLKIGKSSKKELFDFELDKNNQGFCYGEVRVSVSK